MDASQSEQGKHLIDALVIPGGIIAALGNWIGVINGVLTAMVLLTSLAWGVYRVIDMHRKLYPTKR